MLSAANKTRMNSKGRKLAIAWTLRKSMILNFSYTHTDISSFLNSLHRFTWNPNLSIKLAQVGKCSEDSSTREDAGLHKENTSLQPQLPITTCPRATLRLLHLKRSSPNAKHTYVHNYRQRLKLQRGKFKL